MRRYRYVTILLLLVSALTLFGCRKESSAPLSVEASSPNAGPPAVMYNGDIYCTTGRKLPAAVAPEAIVGEITSTVSPSQWPAKEGQANFGETGDPYAITSDGFLVSFEGEWTLFEKQEMDK